MRQQTIESIARRSRRANGRAHVAELDQAAREAGDWTAAVAQRLGISDPNLAAECLKSTLQALRGQLELEQAAAFGQVLPLFARALYFDGWTTRRRAPAASKAAFLARVEGNGPRQRGIKRERAAKAALEAICVLTSRAAMTAVAAALPDELSTLWPDEPAPYFDTRRLGPLRENAGAIRQSRASPSRLRHANRYAQGQVVGSALPERRRPAKPH